jgi:hypothetical protein
MVYPPHAGQTLALGVKACATSQTLAGGGDCRASGWEMLFECDDNIHDKYHSCT